ncbi:MAG TPA: signal peptidase I [Brevundimonas sp.]|nr:signal peptidase I [Brevundimonas sp.]
MIRTIGGGLLIAMLIQTVFAQPFTIPSSSMEPGLVTGDYVVTSKFPYGWSRASLPFDPPLGAGRFLGREAARGDVVVFRLPRDRQQVWVKRVIGLPGDRVRVSDGQLFLNERAVPRSTLGLTQDHDDPDRTVTLVRERLPEGRAYATYDGGVSPGDDTGAIVVPAGHYLVMGDNRDNSLDGRWPADVGVGLLPAGNIVGRAEWVVASWRPGAGLFRPWTWLKLQPDRFLLRVR